MRRSNGGVYSRPVCQHRSARRNNKMEAKAAQGKERWHASRGLVTEGMTY